MRKNILILVALILAVAYRIWLAGFIFRTIIFDMNEFNQFALQMVQGRWPIDCCDRTIGYSVFLAGVYAIFGRENVSAVLGVQISIDLATAWMILIIARRLFGPSVAFGAFLLSLFNPFTASYTGLLLAETIAVFWIVAIAFLLTTHKFLREPGRWWLLGLFLGLLVFTKAAYYYLVFSLPLLLAVYHFRRWMRIIFLAVVLSGVIVGSSYTLVRNLADLHVVSIVPPYNMSYGALYLNFYHGPPRELVQQFRNNPPYDAIYWEYYRVPFGELRLFPQKYKKLFFEKMKTEWPVFAGIVLKNMVWIWDKEHLGTAYDALYPADKWPLRITNSILLGCFFYGVGRYLLRTGHTWKQPIVLFTVLLFCHITFLFSLVSNESRHSIPFYGILMIWAAYGGVKTIADSKQALT